MGRSSITVRLARSFQALPLWIFRFLEWPVVALLSRRKAKLRAIFVLALPRSGSTVTYQLLCHGLFVQYLSNVWNLLYQLPLLGGWLSSFFARRHRSNFQSRYGFVSGVDGPAEGLRFWQWWLDCGLSDRDCALMPDRKRRGRSGYLRKVLNVVTRGQGGPFVTAYLGHVLVPDRVHGGFPEALLIRLRRDPVSNALSLLNSMRVNDATWFSVVPHECHGLDSSTEHERVAAQVYWLNRRLIDAECANEMLTIHYEELCARPAATLERIRAWCLEKGVNVAPKFSLPERFAYKVADVERDPDARKIRHALDLLEERHGKLEEKP